MKYKVGDVFVWLDDDSYTGIVTDIVDSKYCYKIYRNGALSGVTHFEIDHLDNLTRELTPLEKAMK